MQRHTILVAGLLITALLAGCPSDRELAVDVQTDFVPGVEFDQIEVTLDGTPAATLDARDTDSFARRRRVLERSDVPSGVHTVRVALLNRGAPLVARRVQLAFDRSRVVAITITRDCREVTCPSSGATECVGRTCVPPTCSTLGEIECPDPVCSRDSECAASVACSEGVCVDGVCLDLPRTGGCEAGSVCVPERGCVPRATVPDAGPLDAGDADASGRVDAAPTCSPSEVCANLADDDCDGATDCSDTECASSPSCASCVGVTCPECQTCEVASGSCVPADGGPCATGQCWGGSCCAGCWDGSMCVSGTAGRSCGTGGVLCADCGDCAECGLFGGTFQCNGFLGDGNSCSVDGNAGTCNDGDCCTTCLASGVAGLECLAPSGTAECGGVGGVSCSGCPSCQECSPSGRCTPRVTTYPGPGIVCSASATCAQGVCCAGCDDGSSCAPGTVTGACGFGGWQACNTDCSCSATGVCAFGSEGRCSAPYVVAEPMILPVDLCMQGDTGSIDCNPGGTPDLVIDVRATEGLRLQAESGFVLYPLADSDCVGDGTSDCVMRTTSSRPPSTRYILERRGGGCARTHLTIRPESSP